ncbi:MAG: class F sortase [Patescibacteria group bacterium]
MDLSYRLFRLIFIMIGVALLGTAIKAAYAAPLSVASSPNPIVVVKESPAPTVVEPVTLVSPPLIEEKTVAAVPVSIARPVATPAPQKKNSIGLLQIPEIGVDAQVLSMGLEKNGKMAVPNNFVDIGWWNGGALPGEVGTAVLGAHVDNGGSTPGVFKHLSSLAVGDTFQFLRADGTTVTFRVTRTHVYDRSEPNTSDVFLSSDGKAHLNLITCHGEWLPGENTYAERLVVFAERVA